MGQMLDIVPNHMGILGNDNLWWNDVLENGPASPYAMFFDIAWDVSPRAELHDKVLLPILGEPYGHALESQQIRLAYAAGTFTLHYFEHRFPVAPCSYEKILGYRRDELRTPPGRRCSPRWRAYESILTRRDTLAATQRHRSCQGCRASTRQRGDQAPSGHVDRDVPARPRRSSNRMWRCFNGTPGDPHSFDRLDDLLSDQAYRLSYWRVASDEINYRRFFDVNELAALSMDNPEVFAAVHTLIFRLLDTGRCTVCVLIMSMGSTIRSSICNACNSTLCSRVQRLMASERAFRALMGHNGETLLLAGHGPDEPHGAGPAAPSALPGGGKNPRHGRGPAGRLAHLRDERL